MKQTRTNRFITRQQLLRKEVIFASALILLLSFLTVFSTPDIGPAVGSVETGVSIKAPWVFLGVQFLLRFLPPFWAGVLIPFAGLVLLAILPFFDRNPKNQGKRVPKSRIVVVSVFIALNLIIIAAMVAELFV